VLLTAAANLDRDTTSESIANSAAFNRNLWAMLGLMSPRESESSKTAARRTVAAVPPGAGIRRATVAACQAANGPPSPLGRAQTQ
jgi:hypothetical protein